jgi:hypothetical protein
MRFASTERAVSPPLTRRTREDLVRTAPDGAFAGLSLPEPDSPLDLSEAIRDSLKKN